MNEVSMAPVAAPVSETGAFKVSDQLSNLTGHASLQVNCAGNRFDGTIPTIDNDKQKDKEPL
jgi:hypothetical protein